METLILKAGPLKLLFPVEASFASNRQRAARGSKRFKTAFQILVLNDTGEVTEKFSANLDEQSVTLRYDPLLGSVERQYPKAARDIRRSVVQKLPGFWLETRGPLTLSLTPTATADGETWGRA